MHSVKILQVHFGNKCVVMNNMHNHIQKTPELYPGCFENSTDRENVDRLTDAKTPLSSCCRCELPAFERGSNTGAYCA